jgi:hypothetical protein
MKEEYNYEGGSRLEHRKAIRGGSRKRQHGNGQERRSHYHKKLELLQALPGANLRRREPWKSPSMLE